MKVTDIEAFQVGWAPEDRPEQRSAWVRIHCDDGSFGIGEASPMQGGLASLGIVEIASPPPAPRNDAGLTTLSLHRPGGEGRVRGADEPVRDSAHLTLPPLSAHACVRLSDGASPMREGPLPLPPEGRSGALAIMN